MRREVLLWIAAVDAVGCDYPQLPRLTTDAAVIDASRSDGSQAADGPVGGTPCDVATDECCVDHFDGAALDPHWKQVVGDPPTAQVSASRMLISDAPLADTPSTPGSSWIYVLSQDKGNQLAWAQAIGDADFELTAEIGWTSAIGELTLAGVGVADASNTFHALVGFIDDDKAEFGGAYVRIADHNLTRPRLDMTGSRRFRIDRIDGLGSLWIDDELMDAGPLPEQISTISLYYVRYKDMGVEYPFGEVEIREVQICRLKMQAGHRAVGGAASAGGTGAIGSPAISE